MPLSEEQIQEYIDKEKEEAISRIEGELQSKGAGDEYYKFRTFLILNLKIKHSKYKQFYINYGNIK